MGNIREKIRYGRDKRSDRQSGVVMKKLISVKTERDRY